MIRVVHDCVCICTFDIIASWVAPEGGSCLCPFSPSSCLSSRRNCSPVPLALVLPLLRHSRIVSSHIVSLCLQVSLLTCELTPAARHSLSVSLTTGRSYPGIRVTRPPSPRASSLTRGNARASRRASRPLITSSTSCRRSHGSACWHIS